MTKLQKLKFSWQIALLALGVIAIGLHLWAQRFAQEYATYPLLIVIILGALPLIFEITLKIVRRESGADVLAALSMIAAFILQEYLTCLLVMLMLASGQALENYALKRASSVLATLAKRMPYKTRRRVNDHIEEIDINAVEIGDHIVVLPHEVSPVDGIVLEGHGFMDESYLTGEPYRVAKAPGTTVLSGAINSDTVLLIKALRLPKDSRYSQIMKVMREAEQKRPKMRRLADQLGTFFAPLALLVAIVAYAVTSDPLRFLSVLVIATPCPLLIAIPVAIISAISKAARRGIIIRDPTVLERLPTCKTAIFDKTGTLTYGQPFLSEIISEPPFLSDDVLRKVASLEQYSKHPLSTAVMDAAKKARLYLSSVENVSEEPGHGLSGNVDGELIEIVGRKNVLSRFPKAVLPASISGLECMVIIEKRYAATLRFRDEPRKDSKSFVRHLGPFHAFNKVMLLSGDRESEVQYLGEQLGITELLSSQTPEQKLAVVQRETKNAPTLFLGDGINDAPSLKVATVGIAFGKPSDAARESAGAVILESTLRKLDELLHLSNDLRTIALQSAILGMLLSFVGMGFASFGYITPVAGAILQQVIDAAAILNSLRLTWQKEVKVDLPH